MEKQKEILKALEELLASIEIEIKRARMLINNINNGELDDIDKIDIKKTASKLLSYDDQDSVKIVEGVYDGYFMLGSDEKKYPVPMNYSSKTKLVPGDILKLRIYQNGKLIYKLISPAPKRYEKATLSRSDDSKYIAITDDGKTYFLNQAAVTFFKGQLGDELSIILNSEKESEYAAIEAVISNN